MHQLSSALWFKCPWLQFKAIQYDSAVLFQFCFLFGVLGVTFAAEGRRFYNSLNFGGNKLLRDIFDIALNGLPGDALRHCDHVFIIIITVQ